MSYSLSQKNRENLTLLQVGNIPDLHIMLGKQNLSGYDVIIVHVRVNDIDNTSVETVVQKLVHVMSKIKKMAPGNNNGGNRGNRKDFRGSGRGSNGQRYLDTDRLSLSNDLVADEAVYHSSCYAYFFF